MLLWNPQANYRLFFVAREETFSIGIWTLTKTADKEMTYLSKDGIKTSQSSSFPQEPTPKHNIDSPAACRWIQIQLHTNVAWARPNSGIIIWSVQLTGDVTSRQVIGPHVAPLGGKRRYWSIPSMADRGHAICHNNAFLHGYGYVMTTGGNWCRQSTHKT